MHDPRPDGLFAPQRRALVTGLILTITLVAFESLAVATVMPVVKDDLGGLALYGWVFAAFFLASLVGIEVAGQLADRRGLHVPYRAGLVVFVAGLGLAAFAPTMPVLILGRILQGFGAGAIPAMGYAAISRGVPEHLRPRMFATLSTAWVIPGLVGPAVASLIEHAASWRWVFGALVPIVAIAGAMTAPALKALDRETAFEGAPAFDRTRLVTVAALVLGVGMALSTGDSAALVALGLALVGIPVAVWAFDRLQPSGTLRLAAVVPATVAVRGLLTWAFFGADAYVSLALIDGRGADTWVAGLALSAGAMCWSLGSWTQVRFIDTLGPRRLVRTGTLVYVGGLTAMLVSMAGFPVALSVVIWGVAAYGMGLAYSPLSVTVLGAARTGEEGAASSALQLSDTLGIAIGSGIGGAVVALGDGRGWTVASSTSWVFGAALVMAVIAHGASRRLPRSLPHHDR